MSSLNVKGIVTIYGSSSYSEHLYTCRLDQKHKELTRQKEELLKESKAKLATMDNVKAQIDSLIKVCGLLAA